ncbi:MAG: hypothetical protein R3271_12340 [Methylophaga sp.]|uniref:hypothetical protein n=1 Tax=Methylophaga sp. TaxID=2024840 RepID=UPI00299F2878|nr:hypothetical protein [Methylophaga sp.]MDX1751099.1 hypothetical protein [Methylophaga sp.]
MSDFKILDTDLVIQASISFLDNVDNVDDSFPSFSSLAICIKNELLKLATEAEPSKSNKLSDLLSFRKTSNPEGRGKNDLTSNYLKGHASRLVNYESLKSKPIKRIHSLINQCIDLLLHFLINEGKVVMRSKELPLTDFVSHELISSKLWTVFPEFQKFFILFRSPKTTTEYAYAIPEQWRSTFNKHLSSGNYRNLGNIVNCWRKVALRTNASSFAELTTSTFLEYRRLVLYEASLPWGRLIPVLNELGAKIDFSLIEGYTSSELSSVGTLVIDEDGIAQRIEDKTGFEHIRMPELFYTAGLVKTTYMVTKKRTESLFYEEGEWSISDAELSKFIPHRLSETMGNSPWVMSELEYIESLQEEGTRKSARSALKDLNIYLFSYLSWFFDSHKDLPYPFPSCPSLFLSAIYISTSEVVNQSLYGNVGVYPIPFIRFFRVMNSGSNEQTLQGKMQRIRRYFDYCSVKYVGIDGYEIKNNPIDETVTRSIKARSYRNKSTKAILEIDYWLLFSEYLNLFSEKLLSMLEDRHDIPHQGPVRLELSGTIKALDYELELGRTLPLYLQRTNSSDGRLVLAPQYALALSIIASSGLRLSNTMWLEDVVWDNDHIDKKSEYAEIVVSTDKVKDGAFTSVVKRQTYNLLKRFESLKSELVNSPKKAVQYKRSENSKWGELVPFLGVGLNNNNYDTAVSGLLTQLLYDFEHQFGSKVSQLGSHVFLAPIKHKQTATRTHETKAILFDTGFDDYALHILGERGVYFTPIAPRTLVTPHSLRKTLDTHLGLILGTKFVGGIMTGQTEATVEYYMEATPERYERAMAIKGQISSEMPRIASVQSFLKNDDHVRKAFMEKGLEGLGGFRLAVKELNHDELPEQVNPNDIAVNATHICIYGNNCPKVILDKLGKKDCGLCPIAVSTPSDLIAIAAQIRFHADNIQDLNNQIADLKISNSQRTALVNQRVHECEQAASWHSRYEFIRASSQDDDGFIVLDDGLDEVKRTLKSISNLSDGEQLYARLLEVQSSPTLQSHSLKRAAHRFSRKILRQIEADDYEIPEINPLEISLALLQKVASMHKISSEDIKKLLEESHPMHLQRLSNDFNKWLLETPK